MSDKCTHENIVHGASDYWPCPDCGVCFDDDQAFYILMEAKDRELKETQEQLEALKAENAVYKEGQENLGELHATVLCYWQNKAKDLSRQIESLKADKAKVEAEAIEEAVKEYESTQEFWDSEIGKLVISSGAAGVARWFREYASQLETKEK